MNQEMYYFKVRPGEGEEENFTVRDNSLHMMPRGYHTVVSAPATPLTICGSWQATSASRATVDDPQVGWVSKTVAMLKELGH